MSEGETDETERSRKKKKLNPQTRETENGKKKQKKKSNEPALKLGCWKPILTKRFLKRNNGKK